MRRVRNANDFRIQFREIAERYQYFFRETIEQIKSTYSQTPLGKIPSSIDESLEAHIRFYLVNSLLAALNWRLDTNPEDGLPNLVPEVPVHDAERGTTRFLDYLGLERQTNAPLLVVETKRPSSKLPRLDEKERSDTPEEIISQGLKGTFLPGGWTHWIVTLKDYVRAVYQQTNRVPKRVVITNGDWLILFLEPADAFLAGGSANPINILIFHNRDDIEKRYLDLFHHLEHGNVLGKTDTLLLSELPFNIAIESVDRLMHGLRLLYFKEPSLWEYSPPVIKITPVIFIRSRYESWLRVEGPQKEYRLPDHEELLTNHLLEIEQAATDLLIKVNQALNKLLRPSSLSEHYENMDSFKQICGVREVKKDEFLIATGDKTHYLLPEPSVPNCPHHDWRHSHSTGVALTLPVSARSTSPRSFFVSSEIHHCAHRDVITAKSSAISQQNLIKCGVRSGEEGQAFCEIWSFEQHLCCRTCAFETVCTKAEVFKLPCIPPQKFVS